MNYIPKFEDIHLTERDVYNEYLIYQSTNDIAAAKRLLKNYPSLANKITASQNYNKLIEALNRLQERPKTDIDGKLNKFLSEFQDNIDGTIDKGEYDEAIQYVQHNFVSGDNEYYLCVKTPPVGTPLSDTEYFIYLGLRGDKGTPSLGVNFKGEWRSDADYVLLDAVIHKNKMWLAREANLNREPSTNSLVWLLAFDPVLGNGIPVGARPPGNAVEGSIWIKIITAADEFIMLLTFEPPKGWGIPISASIPGNKEEGMLWVKVTDYDNTTITADAFWLIPMDGTSTVNVFIGPDPPNDSEKYQIWVRIEAGEEWESIQNEAVWYMPFDPVDPFARWGIPASPNQPENEDISSIWMKIVEA